MALEARRGASSPLSKAPLVGAMSANTWPLTVESGSGIGCSSTCTGLSLSGIVKCWPPIL